MAVTLIGEILNVCDNDAQWTNFADTNSDISIDGNSVTGKASNSVITGECTTLGATAPYDNGGTEDDYAIVGWLLSLSPVAAVTGVRLGIGDTAAGDFGYWDTPFPDGYTGGFISKVGGLRRPFDAVTGFAVTDTVNGLISNINEIGVRFLTTAKFQGPVDNIYLDQFSIGRGLRVDGTSNNFETIRSADRDTNYWGFMDAAAGSFLAKGGIFIGPANGTTTCTFSDTAAVVTWANEAVHSGFYDLNISGTGTTATFEACLFRQESSGNTYTKWDFTVDGTNEPTLVTDLNSIFIGTNVITMQPCASFTGTKIDRGFRLVQNSGELTQCDFVNSETGDGEALILSDYPDRISNCTFTQSSGHAIEITPTASGKTFTFTGNTFIGYEGSTTSNTTPNSGPTNAAVYNNSSGNITINISNAANFSVRNGPGATTTLVNAKTLTLNNIIADSDPDLSSEVRIFTLGTTTELDGTEAVTPTGNGRGSFTYSFQGGDPNVDIRIFNINYQPADLLNFELGNDDKSQTIFQIFDRNYQNP